ncbi:MAG: hypothetical protein ACREOI_36525 [bacterium]
MLQSLVSQSRSRSWLLGSVAVVIVLIMASCCPPALVDRGVEKVDKPAQVEKTKQ